MHNGKSISEITIFCHCRHVSPRNAKRHGYTHTHKGSQGEEIIWMEQGKKDVRQRGQVIQKTGESQPKKKNLWNGKAWWECTSSEPSSVLPHSHILIRLNWFDVNHIFHFSFTYFGWHNARNTRQLRRVCLCSRRTNNASGCRAMYTARLCRCVLLCAIVWVLLLVSLLVFCVRVCVCVRKLSIIASSRIMWIWWCEEAVD